MEKGKVTVGASQCGQQPSEGSKDVHKSVFGGVAQIAHIIFICISRGIPLLLDNGDGEME